MNSWPLQDAKARLSELVRMAASDGPQGITVRGKEEVVVLSVDAYEKLLGNKPTLVEFMSNSPLKGVDIVIERDKSLPRDIDI